MLEGNLLPGRGSQTMAKVVVRLTIGFMMDHRWILVDDNLYYPL